LVRGIDQVVVGNRVADISRAVQEYVEANGFTVVRQFVGHGIGSALHEAPEIPNFHQGEPTPRLLAGMVLAIEPMVNMGSHRVKVLRDGWTVITEDRQPSAHFEHSVAVTDHGPTGSEFTRAVGCRKKTSSLFGSLIVYCPVFS
jgi:methionyl aminopeptidase